MNRWLAVGAAIVLVGGIFLYFAMQDDASSKGGSSSSASPEPTAKKEKRAPRERPPEEAGSGEPGVVIRDVDSRPREYTVNGVRIRDHRKGSHAPVDLPPNIHPPGQRKIPSTITHAFITQMAGVVKECAAGLPAEARTGAKPRVEGTVFLGIKDKQARTNEAKVQLRDVTGESVDTIKSCIESKSVGLQTTAGEEADLERYSITVSLAL
jgi:hypothetical protein